jgi:glycosyltransferase involved in cell wall biosynthesis
LRNDPEDLARKLVELIDDPARRATMGQAGYERVTRELEWRYEVPKLLAAYDAAFDDGSAG